VEIAWRLAPERARAALANGLTELGTKEIVSFSTVKHPLRRHVLYHPANQKPASGV
jgi:hypothetical protein